MKSIAQSILLSMICLLVMTSATLLAATGGVTILVENASTPQNDGLSTYPSISGNGQVVAFESSASTLVVPDTNGLSDVFLYDYDTETFVLASIGFNGAAANGNSGHVSLSDDGCVVAFHSTADNLVANDTNGTGDVFVYDCVTNTVERISVNASGGEVEMGAGSPSVSGDGQYVAYSSSSNDIVPNDTSAEFDTDVFLHNRADQSVVRVSVTEDGAQANWSSFGASVSNGGAFVAYHSLASNLVSNDTNGRTDVFVYELASGAVERVSVDSSGNQGTGGQAFSFDGAANASISADGRYVSFLAHFGNLVSGDTNGFSDVFVRDRTDGTTIRVSLGPNGEQQDGNSNHETDISDDGQIVAFRSRAGNLVADDLNGTTDVFIYDGNSGKVERVSVDNDGNQADQGAYGLSISNDGTVGAFASYATNLVIGDTNDLTDVFIHNMQSAPTSVTALGQSSSPQTHSLTLIIALIGCAGLSVKLMHRKQRIDTSI